MMEICEMKSKTDTSSLIQAVWKGYSTRNTLKNIRIAFQEIYKEIEGDECSFSNEPGKCMIFSLVNSDTSSNNRQSVSSSKDINDSGKKHSLEPELSNQLEMSHDEIRLKRHKEIFEMLWIQHAIRERKHFLKMTKKIPRNF